MFVVFQLAHHRCSIKYRSAQACSPVGALSAASRRDTRKSQPPGQWAYNYIIDDQRGCTGTWAHPR